MPRAIEISSASVTSILTRTSGFLQTVSSHSLQPYRGCALGNSLCGVGCYVRHNFHLTRGQAWGSFVEARTNAAESYVKQYAREREWARANCGRFGIFLSSSTEPFQPLERSALVTRRVLEGMLDRPPDFLILQSHSHHIADYLDLYRELAKRCELRFHVSVESDRDELPGLPRSASPVAKRMEAAGKLRQAGLKVVVTVSPLLPIDKPMQVLTMDRAVRSIHGASYTRLHNLDLLAVVKEFATDFQPPQTGMNGATGLYCGEQDMFVFLIDPTGWAEIEGEAFAPGFFLWNSEVGRRSIGVQTFWFQAVCQNHIVWDAVEVVDFSRKHTANVSDSLREIRRIIAQLVERRDERRDGFARVMKKAFETRLGDKAEDVAKVLFKHGIPRDLAKQALAMAERQGRFTIFSLVDALTRISGQYEYAGDRLEAEEKSCALLALAEDEPRTKPRAQLAMAV